MRLEINYRKKTEKNKHKKVKQNVINQWISEKKLKENLKIPRQLTMKTWQSKSYETQQKQF